MQDSVELAEAQRCVVAQLILDEWANRLAHRRHTH
jgi:hypothetical protein